MGQVYIINSPKNDRWCYLRYEEKKHKLVRRRNSRLAPQPSVVSVKLIGFATAFKR